MKRSVLLSSFLVAAVLSPVALYGNTCLPVGDAKLAVLQLRVDSFLGENTIEGFDPDVLAYDALFPESATVGVLWVKAQDLRATIEVEYDGELVPLVWHSVAKLDVPLGSSELSIHVSANPSGSAQTSQTYVVRIRRGESCEQVGCDDDNECTEDLCNTSNGLCENSAVADGSPCGGETYVGGPRGGCYRGLCNFVPVSVAIGPKEVVFDWSAERCEDFDLPDCPAKFVRAEDGELVLFASDAPTYYLSRGAEFDSLQRVCDPPALVSANLPTPESYENQEWLWSPYREGASWHVLIHNEFHPPEPPPCNGNNCWYNSITYAVSTDNARTFVKPSPPSHVVAPAPTVWTPPTPETPTQDWFATGYFTPTNIVRGPDDYYYTIFSHMDWASSEVAFQCAMRTNTLDDPTSWRAWDGSGFTLPLSSPYVAGGDVPECEPVGPPLTTIGDTSSLTYNTYLERYMWVGVHIGLATGEPICGIHFSLSTDLVHWSELQLIVKVLSSCETNPDTPGLLERVQVGYPSIIDRQDSSTNFERPGRFVYMYYTRENDDYWLNRDLISVPLTFTLGGALCEGVDCDDQNECTEDVCNGADGSCEHPPIDCVEDRNDCTVDTCTPGLGCNATAADATPCAGGTCQAGACELTGSVLPCTEQGIRNAVAAGGGPYTFSCGGPTTVVTQAEIVIDNSVILDGEGRLTVDGNTGHRVFSVAAGVAATLMNVTVTGGADVLVGGGILNEGTLVLSASTITGNTSNRGGGVANQSTGTLTVTNCTVSENTAGAFAGGLRNLGLAEVIDTNVSNNTATINNGGVTNRPGATMTLIRTTVEGNIAGVTAGGIQNDGTLTVINATVSGNEAGETGGGITNNATLTLVSTTVSGNTAPVGGAIVSNSGSVSARNVIIEGQCQGPPLIDSLGGNIESPGNTCFTSHPADQVSLPAPLLLLGPLQDNGGPTMTHALLPGSEAIDWIPEAMCIGADGQLLTTDQRGQPRPAGPGCDVGSFEVQP